MRDELASWIGEQLGTTVGVAELRRITTGHSRGNWFLELDDGSRFVVRVEQGGVFGTSGADEFEFMQAVGRLGFPVARVRWLEHTGDVIGQPFFVMDFIEGGVATEREDRSLAPELAVDFVRRLDELHQLDWAGRARRTTAERGDARADRALGRRLPVVVAAAGAAARGGGRVAARTTRPPLERVALVHGDPGPGNFVHDGRRVLAFTDWEFSHLGDPTEDWSFLLSMRGARTMPVEDWLALVQREVGVEVDESQLRYWRAFNFFKGACANRSCLKSFAGANPAPNMALIGTVLQQTFMRQLADLVGQRSGVEHAGESSSEQTAGRRAGGAGRRSCGAGLAVGGDRVGDAREVVGRWPDVGRRVRSSIRRPSASHSSPKRARSRRNSSGSSPE